MPIDPRISLSFVPPQIDWSQVDPFARQQKQLTIEGMQGQAKLRELQMQQQQLQLEQMKKAQVFQDELNNALTGKGQGYGSYGNAPVQAPPVSPDNLKPIPPEAYLYEEPQLMRPAGPEGRAPGTMFAPAGMQTRVTVGPAPAGMGPTGSPLNLPDPGELIRRGGTYAFPLAKTITELQDAQLKRQHSQLTYEKDAADLVARKLNGVIDDKSLSQILPWMADNKLISSDEARQYIGLGHDDPRTQAWLKSIKGQSIDYMQSIDAQIKQDKDAREKFDQDRTDIATRAQGLTSVDQFPGLLAEYGPRAQKFYGGLTGITDLGNLKQAAVVLASKPKLGETVPELPAVQQQKIDISAAQGLAAKQAELGFQNKKNAAAIQNALNDPTGKVYANYPPDLKKEIAPALADRGFTAWGDKPSDTERKNLNFYERAKDAEDSILKVPEAVKGGPAPKSLEQIITEKDVLGQLRFQVAPNWAQTKEGRQYWQALRQFTEARLRKESGAAIAPHEYEESQQTYFPVPGDDKETLDRKRKARQGLLESMKTEAGPAYTQKYGETKTSDTGTAKYKAGSRVTRNGETWEYIGPGQGDDWRDPKNWTKVTMQ